MLYSALNFTSVKSTCGDSICFFQMPVFAKTSLKGTQNYVNDVTSQ